MRLTAVHLQSTPQELLLRIRAAFAATLVGAFCVLAVPAVWAADSMLPITAASENEAKTQKLFTIGIEDTLDPWFFVQTFAPTMAHLRETLPNIEIRTTILNSDALTRAAEAKTIDAFIATSGFYAFARTRVGAQHIATRRHPLAANPAQSSGAVFLVRLDAPFKTIADLRGKTVAATDPQSFDGWLVALGELLQYTDRPERFFGDAKFTNYAVPDPITLLTGGYVDAAIVKICDIERLLASGQTTVKHLHVLDPKPAAPGAPRCLRSTALYPELVFATLPHADPETVEDAARSLLAMPPLKEGWRWGLSNSFGTVDALYKSLKIGPYEYLRRNDWRYFFDRYREYVFIALGLVLLMLAHILRTNRLVALRTAQLRETLAQKERAEEEAASAREKLARHDRLTIVASMSNMIVHELTQPITSLMNFTAGLRLYLKNEKDEAVAELCRRIEKQAERIADIVGSVRTYARGERTLFENVDIPEAAKRALHTFSQSSAARGVRLVEDWSLDSAVITGSALEMELLVLNLLKNAAAAAKKNEKAKPEVRLRLFEENRERFLTVEDTGPRLDEAAFRALSEPSSGLSGEGLGLGLNLCRSIAEHHGITISFERLADYGIRVTLRFPNAIERPSPNTNRNEHQGAAE